MLRENLTCALRALTLNLLRTALTLTGMVVGVLAIVSLIAILQGVKHEIRSQIEGLGANLVIVVPGKLDENGQPNPAAEIGISTLSEEDVTALKRVPGVRDISPVSIVAGTVDSAGISPGKSSNAFVLGTNQAGVRMNPTPLAEGRYFEDGEQHVCVMGYRPKENLFGKGSALGKFIQVQGHPYRVVGVLAKPGSDGAIGSQLLGLATLVYLPIEEVRKEIPGGQVNRIVLRTDYLHPAETVVATMNKALVAAHDGRDDFGILTQEKGLALVIRILSLAQSLLVLIAGISLFVAAIGITNIMLVTVTERTHEIGIRKTVGARRRDIFYQFLCEAMILSIIGGAIGVLLSWFFCIGIAHFSVLNPRISPGLIALALLVCSAVGLTSGIVPAVLAARLDPIAALRHD